MLIELEPIEKNRNLLEEVKHLQESLDRVRKGTFAKIGSVNKKYDDIKHEFDMLKSAICKSDL